MVVCLLNVPCTPLTGIYKSTADARAEFTAEQLTDHLDKEAAIVNQHSLSMNLYVHLDKQLDLVQMADEQSFTICRDDSQRASTAVFISDERDKDKF